MSETETAVVVVTTIEEVEAEMIYGILQSAEIGAWIEQRVSAGVANRLTRTMHGTVYDVVVPARDAEKARTLLAAYEEGQGQVSEEELAAAADESYDPLV